MWCILPRKIAMGDLVKHKSGRNIRKVIEILEDGKLLTRPFKGFKVDKVTRVDSKKWVPVFNNDGMEQKIYNLYLECMRSFKTLDKETFEKARDNFLKKFDGNVSTKLERIQMENKKTEREITTKENILIPIDVTINEALIKALGCMINKDIEGMKEAIKETTFECEPNIKALVELTKKIAEEDLLGTYPISSAIYSIAKALDI